MVICIWFKIQQVVIKDVRKIGFLIIMYLIYLAIGALVFQHFEAPLEQKMKQEVAVLIQSFNAKLEMLSQHQFRHQHRALDRSYDHGQLNLTNKDITELIHKFLLARDMNLVDQWGNRTNHHWNFLNSFFFSITVVTTIGYGHLLPSTVSGKIFCLFYALFGIPITGLLLGAIGNLFSRCFMTKIRQLKQKYQDRDVNTWSMFLYIEHAVLFFVPWFVVFLIIPSAIFVLLERWTFLESFYYSFITLTTIGFGDYVAGNYEGSPTWVAVYKLMVVLWIIFGLSYLSMVLNFIGRGYQKVEHTEIVHSVAHLEPFLHKKRSPDLSSDDKDGTGNHSKQRRHSFTTSSESVYKSLSAEDHHHHHHHHKLSSTSVIPYYP